MKARTRLLRLSRTPLLGLTRSRLLRLSGTHLLRLTRSRRHRRARPEASPVRPAALSIHLLCRRRNHPHPNARRRGRRCSGHHLPIRQSRGRPSHNTAPHHILSNRGNGGSHSGRSEAPVLPTRKIHSVRIHRLSRRKHVLRNRSYPARNATVDIVDVRGAAPIDIGNVSSIDNRGVRDVDRVDIPVTHPVARHKHLTRPEWEPAHVGAPSSAADPGNHGGCIHWANMSRPGNPTP